jgi:hypothetical protein
VFSTLKQPFGKLAWVQTGATHAVSYPESALLVPAMNQEQFHTPPVNERNGGFSTVDSEIYEFFLNRCINLYPTHPNAP